MMQRLLMTRRNMLFSLAGMLVTAMLALYGCGGSGSGSYTDPNDSITTTKTATALIEPATLKQWMDEGKVNNPDPATRDRVVIVSVGTPANYATAHIPGSQLLDSGALNLTRLEGVTAIGTMVMDGPTIDGHIQRLGINQYTTIVIAPTGTDSAMNASRVYFTLRYWGFPKERVKILNGGQTAWTTAAAAWPAAYAATATAPTIPASTFSVKNLYNGTTTTNFNLRYSIGEMINLVDKINAGTISTGATGVAIMDERGGVSVTAHPYIANAATYNNGTTTVLDNHANYYGTVAGSFKDTATITANLANFGVTANKSMTYLYCASGMRASTAFFVLDGILGWPVTLYDGSWYQWSGYTSLAPATNLVSPAWQTNVNTSATVLVNRTANAALYTAPRTTLATDIGAALTLDPTAKAMYSTITDPRANQMLNEDKAYFTSGGGTTTTGGGSAGTGSGC
ncbi:MAG: selenite/tellurite reduction operon rhodanese-like protein ExtH [Geobacter sp.]|nr:selenite/tellurite reduction operon rhodanese-like protein ExtH [Geobacter sp.]